MYSHFILQTFFLDLSDNVIKESNDFASGHPYVVISHLPVW